jgi:hypothetical protein
MIVSAAEEKLLEFSLKKKSLEAGNQDYFKEKSK